MAMNSKLKILTWLMVLSFSNLAFAYKYSCSSIFRENSINQIDLINTNNAIENYMKIFSINQLGHDKKSLDYIKLNYRKLSSQNKLELLNILKLNYNTVKLLKYNQEGPYKTFKRHLDLIIGLEMDSVQFFREKVDNENKSIEEALNLYFEKMQKALDLPLTLEGSDLMLTAMRLQEKYAKHPKSMMVLYGSFVNGKAYTFTSDLDFAVTDARQEVLMKEVDILKTLEDFPFSEAQAHVMTPRSINSLGSMNPLVVIIKQNYIVLRVYDLRTSDDFKNNNIYFDEYYF